MGFFEHCLTLSSTVSMIFLVCNIYVYSIPKMNLQSRLVGSDLQCVTIEFRQSPVYVVNEQYSNWPDRC